VNDGLSIGGDNSSKDEWITAQTWSEPGVQTDKIEGFLAWDSERGIWQSTYVDSDHERVEIFSYNPNASFVQSDSMIQGSPIGNRAVQYQE
jgi:hypothetical protein